jgi:uncharacterized membrane protein
MPATAVPLIEAFAFGLEYTGVAVIVAGIAIALLRFAAGGLRGPGWTGAYERCRAELGRAILLGLEILVGADIIATVTAPLTWESVGLLGLVVLIRTFLSFSLETEIEGRWPWRQRDLERRG